MKNREIKKRKKRKRGRPRAPSPPDFTLLQTTRIVIHIVSRIFDVTPAEIRQPSRGTARVALARQVAMYLTHIACGLSYSDTARLFSRDRTTVAYACAKIEDRRDDPQFDEALTHSERAALCLMTATVNQEH